MPFEEFTIRANPRLGDASVMLRVRKADGRPSLIISILKSFADVNALPVTAGDRIDVLVGNGDEAGKVRIRKTNGKGGGGCGVMKAFRTGGYSADCGHISALGMEGRSKVRVPARVIDEFIEIDLPKADDWAAAEEELDDDAAAEEGEGGAAEDLAADHDDDFPIKGCDVDDATGVTRAGIEVDFKKEFESITFRGTTMEVTRRQAYFVAALLRVAPSVVARDFLRKKIAIGAGDQADAMIDLIAKELGPVLKDLGLVLKTVPSIGYVLGKL
jgi:hypothetical protein